MAWKGRTAGEKNCLKVRNISIPYVYLAAACILLGVVARVMALGDVPGGINQDEAFSGYEAYSLLHYGVDSAGYSFPVYLVAWGSGMNVLNTYLIMPFMALFGSHAWVVRFPQVLVACFSLLVVYLLLKRIFDEKTALFGVFILAVCPWHIMMARWGLESNLAPGFLLFGLYFFLVGVERPRFYLLSALFYGLSLYCYATIWPIVPIILLLQLLYLLYTKKVKWDRWLFLAVGILVLFAIPLILFLLVNTGHLGEIRTPFLSVPKLAVMRDSEISFTSIPENFKNMFTILVQQDDGLYWNSTPEYGLYYKGMLVFALIGFIVCGKKTWDSIRERKYDGAVFILINFLGAFILGCLVSVNVNRINCIHIPLILMMAVGMAYIVRKMREEIKSTGVLAVAVLLAAFFSFEGFYYTTYAENIGSSFQEGLEEALSQAETLAGEEGDIYISSGISYSKILFYSEYPAPEYHETVQYTNYPAAFLDVSSFGRYHFGISGMYPGAVLLISENEIEPYENAGYEVDRYENIGVVQVN